MWLLMVEAGVALFLLVFIVWWTMYQGKQANHDEVEAPAAPETAHDAFHALDKTDRPDGPPR